MKINGKHNYIFIVLFKMYNLYNKYEAQQDNKAVKHNKLQLNNI